MITPRSINPNFEANATIEGIAYFLLVMLTVAAIVIYFQTRKENKDGFNRPIFYRKHRFWACVINRRNASIVCGALFFTWVGFYLDRLTLACN
jgi:amino acid transporter